MGDPRIYKLVTACATCDNRVQRQCAAAGDANILHLDRIAPFCPLPVFPASRMSDLERTADLRNDPNQFHLGVAIMAHLSVKLKTTLDAVNLSIAITYKEGNEERTLTLHPELFDHITREMEIIFFDASGKKFGLRADGHSPALRQFIMRDGEELSTSLTIVVR